MAAHWALWIAIVAPVISQTLAQPHLPFECGPRAVLAILNHAAIDAGDGIAQATDHDQIPDPGHGSGDACGYCSLFAHLPFALAVAVGMAILPPLPIPRRPFTSTRPKAWQVVHAFDSRGPPAIPY